ncbi:MAG: CDP-diacylglycerol--glycerol-3-phosphate 3-phosphatidyltransferase [Azospira oryzae]|uniref:CDP-diacylglycerol--glycerol-3-phosphate 3-phosphatidyltransferase n=1 Tax=Pelomicrobium methylotrophicum TaxID=2602750 RepID=A0A5C7ELJ5_9PROT|nr:CDP-diacylglycerol--glycerol-3-phosphate 3-phosphatidyltransferase [Pelomicrobium methylotrophicum]PZP56393.1 MAG: CDP-diacylglycerol--glycerol-3-phosphate 3-phosphatidyltransferase [Azospira oryzae]PZP78444.1 MAG: CDP-diacylglycerol--glycerol-3-phosphate 3-phosphatidyltransferase [Azospira oryzae]TXF13594.1 CDP-diacylglycerol--glycerol-3-phosphate 3-phosphatidyltransferase [Pelomicrobium methylotrophicum]
MTLNIPNLLTWLRILLIPVFVGVFYFSNYALSPQHKNIAAAFIFALAAITDWLDGYLARALRQTSAFGAFLDPVADKLMVAAALIVLVELGRVHALIALIIIGREIAISALREWMARIGESKSVAVSLLGKIKTVAQMAAILLLLYQDHLVLGVTGQGLGTVLIYLAAGLTLLSMAYYLKMALPRVADRV